MACSNNSPKDESPSISNPFVRNAFNDNAGLFCCIALGVAQNSMRVGSAFCKSDSDKSD